MTGDPMIAAHYSRDGLGEAIAAALAALGKDPRRLTPQDLAPIDEFHIRGSAATQEMAEWLDLTAGSRVVDLGCGLGGASRHLAATYGARVVGIDLTAEYLRAAAMLADWLGLADQVEYRLADALALPFADESFDVAWTQHSQMNVADKRRLYAEARRVLRPDGRLVFYDVLAGPGGAPHLPVPWASTAAQNHLASAEELRALLSTTGFDELRWQDWTAAGRAWFARLAAGRGKAPPAPTLRLLLGPAAAAMVANLRRNLDEGRIMLAAGLYRRAG